MSFWCHDPGVGFKYLSKLGPRNILLTSGTLTPLSSFESELKIAFGVKLVNDHIIDPKTQCLTTILKKGINGVPLNFSYDKRESDIAVKELGNCLVNFSRVIPHGMLIFFSSYSVMNRCLDVWSSANGKEKTILQRLEDSKPTFREPKITSQMKHVMDDYTRAAKAKGAILFAVCRGKASEGIDFTDEMARAVVLVGIPYPSLVDRRVELKKQYLDSSRSAFKGKVSLVILVKEYLTAINRRKLQEKTGTSNKP